MLVVAGASCRAPRVNSHTGVSTPTNCASDRSVRSFNAQLCSNFQCNASHTVPMRIEQSTSLFLCGGGGALRQLPAAPSHEG